MGPSGAKGTQIWHHRNENESRVRPAQFFRYLLPLAIKTDIIGADVFDDHRLHNGTTLCCLCRPG